MSEIRSAATGSSRRKPRSRHVATLLMGTAMAAGLAACGDDAQEPKLYTDFAACVAERTEAECREAERQAQTQHAQAAPRFTSLATCEAQMGPGNCVSAPGQVVGDAGSGGGWFMPAIAGFLLGRALSGGSAMPVYYDRQGYAYAGGQPYGQLSRRDQEARASGGWNRYQYDYSRSRTSVPSTSGPLARAPASGGGIDVRPPTPGQPPLSAGSTSSAARAPTPSPQINRGGFGSTGRSVGLSSGG